MKVILTLFIGSYETEHETSLDVDKTGTAILDESCIESIDNELYDNDDDNDDDDDAITSLVEGLRDCHSFKSTLEREGFWNKTSLKTNPSKIDSAYCKIQGEVLTDLCGIFGSDLKLKLSIRSRLGSFIKDCFDSKEMSVTTASSNPCKCKRLKFEGYCEDQDVKISEGSVGRWLDYMLGPDDRDIAEIFITVSGSFCKSFGDPDVSNKTSIYEKMLNEKIETDVEILAKDGTSIPCHRALLMAQSPVFFAMFQNDFKESKTNTIKTDIPVESLKPFLDYLYSYEISKPSSDPQIAIDLLEAGHKYDVKTMETKMEKILIDFPDEIYTSNEAIRLFLFVRNVKKFQSLRMKVGSILKHWGPDVVSKCAALKELTESPSGSVAVKDLMLNFMTYMIKKSDGSED